MLPFLSINTNMKSEIRCIMAFHKLSAAATRWHWVSLNIVCVSFAGEQTTQADMISDNLVNHFTAVPEVHDVPQRQNFPVTYGEY